MFSPYRQLCILDTGINGIGQKTIEVSTSFLQEEIELEEASVNSDRELLKISRTQAESTEALLLLRCRVSHPISEKIRFLFNKFREKYELDLKDMSSCVLDDSGENFLRIYQKTDEGEIETVRKPFNWGTLVQLSANKIRPFGADIIYNFDPNLSSLSTWAKNKVQAHLELKKYLRSCGLLMITPWALIADSTATRVKESWLRYGEGSMEVKEVLLLHNSYLIQYKKAKEIYKRLKGKASGWLPDAVFLSSLSPPQKDVNGLKAIDKAIRLYLSCTNYARRFEEGEESQIASDQSDNNDDLSNELFKSIHQSLKRAAIPILETVIKADSSRWEKDPSRKLAWELYAQGLSQRTIATRCEHKQAWVSKLLSEKILSGQIAQEAAVELIRRPEFHTVKKDPEGVDRMIEQLTNYLVAPAEEEKISPLRQIINVVLNQ